jgi:hypothetical protein
MIKKDLLTAILNHLAAILAGTIAAALFFLISALVARR